MSDNQMNFYLDLNSEIGRKALVALAEALGDERAIVERPVTGPTYAPLATAPSAEEAPTVEDVEAQPDPTPAPATAVADESASEEVEDSAPAKPARPAEKGRRRRTKAQIEEDRAEGLDDAFKDAAKQHPDLDVDTIRDMIRGNREAEEAAPDEPAPPAEPAPEAPAEQAAEPAADWAPDWGDDSGGESDDDWTPSWA